jgi:hypothetical protein
MKGIILIGVGKSKLAEIIIDGRKSYTIQSNTKIHKGKFTFSFVDANTEVLFFDNVNLHQNDITYFYSMITDGIRINKLAEPAKIIYPQIILAINCRLKDIPINSAIKMRYNVFELSASR